MYMGGSMNSNLFKEVITKEKKLIKGANLILLLISFKIKGRGWEDS